MQNLNTRNADLGGILDLLREQQARKHDLVVPASAIRVVNADLIVSGADQEITLDGVTTVDGTYRPTAVADEGIAEKLRIPRAYLRTMRETRPDLYDANVNGWLHGADALMGPWRGDYGVGRSRDLIREGADGDARRFLLRTFKGDDGDQGIARAFLSDTYKVMDNLDVLMASLDGVREAGVAVNIDGGDLTDRRMVLRLVAPEVQALAPVLLRGYRSPFSGASGDENPTVFAGFQISNSEVGNGAFSITPRLVVQVCNNGMTITKDAMRSVHLGGKMDEGIIRWSDETQQRNLALVKSQTRDAVRTFLDTDYMTRVIQRAEAAAEEAVTVVEHVRTITKPLGYTDEQIDGIMGHFVRGGQMTRGGVANAITSYAQTVEDGDAAHDVEARAMQVLGV